MKIYKSVLQKLIQEVISEESQSAQQAHKMGLTSGGFGRWKNKSGKTTHISRGGKLVPVKGSATPTKKSPSSAKSPTQGGKPALQVGKTPAQSAVDNVGTKSGKSQSVGQTNHPVLSKPEYQKVLKWLGKEGQEIIDNYQDQSDDEYMMTDLEDALWQKTNASLDAWARSRGKTPGMKFSKKNPPDLDDVREVIKSMPPWPAEIDTPPSEIAQQWIDTKYGSSDSDEY